MIDRFLMGGRCLIVVVCLGVVVGCTPNDVGVSEAGLVNTSTFENIKPGMSMEDVEKIAPGGMQSWEPGWDSLTYLEYNVGGAKWLVAFKDGKVIEKGAGKGVREKVKEAVEAGTDDPKVADEESED